MTRMMHIVPVLLLTCLCAAQGADSRIRTLAFADSKVVRLAGCPNFQTMVRFGAGEKIENVGLGDASQWQITPNRRADLLFVKPLQDNAFSNMTVVTSRHTYDFELKTRSAAACARGDVVYDLRFTYPAEPKNTPGEAAPGPKPPPKDALPLPEKRNTAYTYHGDKILVPLRAFDDGHSTYFRWADGIPIPAIYAVAPDGTETIVNYTIRGEFIVIQQIAMAFRLRKGKLKASLFNDSFVVPKLDAKSPQPIKEEEDGFWPF